MRATLARGVSHFSYTPLLGAAALLSFGKLLVYAQLVSVEQFGALGKMFLASAVFGIVASLGLQSVASRDVPALFARGRGRRGIWLLAQAIGVSTCIAALCLLAAAFGFTLFDMSAAELALGTLHGWVQFAFLTAAFESRSRLQMKRYAGDMALRGLAVAVGGAAAGFAGLGATGIVLAEIGGTLVFLALVGQGVVARGGIRWSWLAFALRPRPASLPWRAAVLMLAGSLVMFASSNLDRWIAAESLPRDAFGVYAFAWLPLLAAQSVQGLLNSGLMPLLSQRRAQSLEASAFRLTWLMAAALASLGLVLALPVAWSLTWSIERWMPGYREAVPLLLPLILAALLRVADFWSSFLLVVEREATVLVGQLAAVVAAAAGFTLWLAATDASPTPLSLAWLAFAAAVLSHGASAGSVLMLWRRDPDRRAC